MLCDTCVGLLEHQRGWTTSPGTNHFVHQESAADLALAAAQGCMICHAFWDKYMPDEKTQLLLSDAQHPAPARFIGERVGDQGSLRWHPSESQYLTHVTLRKADATTDGQRWRGCLFFGLHLRPERGLKVPHLGTNTNLFALQPEEDLRDTVILDPLTTNTGSEASLTLARKWAYQCIREHATCRAAEDGQWCPTRLLDLGRGNGLIRLIDTNDESLNITGRYMTLSHRWGSANVFALERANEEGLRAGFLTESLPRCFQDATTVTRSFGVRYLWIDSLCISQDRNDLGDWIRQSSTMDKVYANSMLNTSSLVSKDSSMSLFSDRVAATQCVPSVQVDVERIGLGLGNKTFKVIDMFALENGIANTELNQRAWVLQERVLAPRVLHFGRNGLIWECSQIDATEAFPAGMPAIMSSQRFKDMNAQRYSASLGHLAQFPRRPHIEPYRLWHRIVSHYTKCGLTRATDKLVAISGVAKHFVHIVNDTYVAGMWRHFLDQEILWTSQLRIRGRAYQHQRQREYRAPSWSWASLDGPIMPPELRDHGSLTRILEVHLDYATPDQTSSLTGGFLLLECDLRALSVSRDAGALTIDAFILTVSGTEIFDHSRESWDRFGVLVCLDEAPQYFDPCQCDGDLYCVPACCPQDGEDQRSWFSMLLLQVVDAKAGTFRRFGIANTQDKHYIAQLLEPERRHSSVNRDLPCVRRAGERYVIRLI